MTRRILIAGGGTGGHLFPGLALAHELRRRGVDVTFVGTRRGIEARAVPPAGFPLRFIEVAGLKRMGLFGTVRGALQLPRAAWQAARLLRELRPDGVVGVGGYASGPVGALAALWRIPLWVLEQNSVPGVTNRLLGRLARTVFIAFPEAAEHFPRVSRLGNPIRAELLQGFAAARPAAPGQLRVLVLGGSQGAHAVNELVAGAVERWVAEGRAAALSVVHQSGAADEAQLRARYQALGLSEAQVRVQPFIHDMGQAYAAADVVVGRAGATTLAELTALGLPAILIPLPTAADDHQTRNARWLKEQGAAEVLVQATAQPADLSRYLAELSPDRLRAMAAASRALGQPHAAAAVADAILG